MKIYHCKFYVPNREKPLNRWFIKTYKTDMGLAVKFRGDYYLLTGSQTYRVTWPTPLAGAMK